MGLTQLHMVCCIKTSFIFLLDKRAPNNPCLGSIAEQSSFIFLLEHGPAFWSLVLCACRFVFRSGSLDIIGVHWGSTLTLIVRGDALIDNAVLQINVFARQRDYLLRAREMSALLLNVASQISPSREQMP